MMLVGSESWAVCYVDQNAKGKNDGSSWANAYVHPQLALINGCTEIWVAKGVYTPVLAGSDPTVSFDIPAGTKMYGGFAGSESSIDQRLPATNQVILSGDVDHNDYNPGNWMDRTAADIVGSNSNHIVIFYGTSAMPITLSTVLDGFLIAGGNTDNNGGGSAIICSGETDSVKCTPILNNLVLAGNKSESAGAVYLQGGGDIAVSNSIFIGNSAQEGGALFVSKSSGSALFTKCAFINNSAAKSGGAASTYANTHMYFENVTFSGNVAFGTRDAAGGALDVEGGELTLTNTTFSNNFVPGLDGAGGAIVANAGGPISIRNTIFWNNKASSDHSYDDVALYGPAGIEHSVLAAGCPTGVTCTTITSEDPRLSYAGNHGGSTITLLPGAGGSAIDNGDNSVCPLVDQRGVPRTDGRCDIGAVEWRLSDDTIFRNGFQ